MKNSTLIPILRFPEYKNTWVERRLEDITSSFQSGKSITAKHIAETGLYPVYGGNGLRGYTDSFNHKGCYILIGRQGALCGNINVIDGETFVSEHAIAVQTNYTSDNNWLAQKLDFMNLNQYSESSAQPGLAVNKLLRLKLRVPSLSEQQKIAAFLTAVDDKIQQLTKKKALLQQYKKGVMQQIFSHEIRFKADSGKDYRNWEERKLGEVARLQGGYAFKSMMFRENGIPVIRISNISNTNNYMNMSNLVYYDEIHNAENFTLRNGDLIMAMSGATTGKASIYNMSSIAYVNQRVGLFKSRSIELYYPFLIHFVFSTAFHKQLESILVAGAQPNVSSSDIEEMILPFPSHQEQTKIASFLSALDDKINHVNLQLEHTRRYKKGLLQQMFV